MGTIENVLLIAVHTNTADKNRFKYSLEELQALVETANGRVVKTVIQNRSNPHQAYYLGEGKLSEIAEMIRKANVELIIANEELTGGQIRNLQEFLDIRVIDRSQLILDIFAARARTKEGKLQVELAQYAYMLPRLHGQGSELSRLGGGIGTRGPGETKLETDRRHIQRRMDDIKKRLTQVVNQREQYREKRRRNTMFQIALVGYTNAGKSTIFNSLAKSNTLNEDKLFATLDPLTRKLYLPSGLEVIITDTVGFIQDLPTELIAAFRSTLEEVKDADIILHVTDVSAPNMEDHERTVKNLLNDLNANQIPALFLYNKKDLINQEQFVPDSHPYLLMSAKNDLDINIVKEKIESLIKEIWQPYQCFLPESLSHELVFMKQHSLVTHYTYNESQLGYKVEGYVDPEHPVMKQVKEYSM
ncbi:GTPase HflX [Gracilibacillus sp. YIM 98692]|uniref:GTPase HflX n=1 Tax=Gracilibacillus sp. YIM 98692 TaxID=2663532 RepID=UPI0013D85706|nr:GTPase HflX [Gracilibacillus sp. YIM 98692]